MSRRIFRSRAGEHETMIKRMLGMVFVVGVGIVSTSAWAESQYNPYTRRWENVSPGAAPRMNPYTGHWELASPDAVGKLNPYTNKFEMVPSNSIPRFNPYSKKYELAPPDATLERNTQTGEWHYPR
jgi:hypothetical protein